MTGVAVALMVLLLVVSMRAAWTAGRVPRHERQPCVSCGVCCCDACRSTRRRAPWLALAAGGYHACRPEPLPVSPYTAEQLADMDDD